MMSMQGMLDGFDAPAARSAEVARVIVDVDLAHMDRSLDYIVPDALVDQAQVGSLVRVRFSGNRVDGWIVERTRREVDDHVGRVESVVSATPVLTPALYEASRRIASRFLATTSQVFSLALPPRHARAEKEELASKPPAWPTIIDKSLGEGWRAYPAGRRSCPVCASGNLRAPSSRRCALICARACRTPWPRPWPRDALSSS